MDENKEKCLPIIEIEEKINKIKNFNNSNTSLLIILSQCQKFLSNKIQEISLDINEKNNQMIMCNNIIDKFEKDTRINLENLEQQKKQLENLNFENKINKYILQSVFIHLGDTPSLLIFLIFS